MTDPSAKDRSDPRDRQQQGWMADGVRHQVLLRALRGQRHDVLGPLAAARMVLATLKRRLSAVTPDPAGASGAMETLSSQLADAVQAIALMRVWDGRVAAAVSIDSLLKTCADLLRTDASVRGHRLLLADERVDDVPVADVRLGDSRSADARAAQADVRVASPDGHYALLAWLMHHLDACSSPSTLTLRRLPASVQLTLEVLDPGAGVSVAPQDTATRLIDADALRVLLDDMGWCQMRSGTSTHELCWPGAYQRSL